MRRSKLASITILLVFFANFSMSKLIDYVQSNQPSAYDILTGSVNQLVDFIKQYWISYAITVLFYLFVWFLLVMLVTTIMCLAWHLISYKKYLKALKSWQIHLSVFAMLVLSIPLNQIGFKFPIAYYLTIPKTFIDMIKNPMILVAIGVIYLIFAWLVFRLRMVAYLALTTSENFRSNVKKSWQTTKKQEFKLLSFILQLVVLTILVMGGLFLVQRLFDQLLTGNVKFWEANLLVAIGVGYFYFMTSQLMLLYTVDSNESTAQYDDKITIKLAVYSVLTLLVVGGASTYFSGKSIKFNHNNQFLVIAHKGVTSENKTGNTIEQLQQTVKAKPDYIEMDIQPTKDGVFVLSHDGKIKAENGKEYQIDQTSWQELKRIRYKEKGQSLSLTSFDDYIKRANQLHQKLLVELKINGTISNDQLQDFEAHYGKALQENKSQLQSLNQNIMKRLSRYSKNKLGILSPVLNSVDDAKFSQFYAIEYSNANAIIARKIVGEHKSLYVWTVNHTSEIASAHALGAKGYITDYPKQTRNTLQKLSKKAAYADAIWNIVMLQKTNI
ncbi:glycerophosphodiester phosphodiesterase family protein [Leuconostoc palmae]|uniref:glycerophosphodiester phosphodiesterase family protein n=1 Tax=Leuconostoc palmae TaxID=501487 RepID=UPI001FEAF6E5|nr:glycerophosphodiester phosphodiesterase family protein [Leuconostoc palmae]